MLGQNQLFKTVAAFLPTVTFAELGFYCENKSDRSLNGYGDIDFYEECGEFCDCSVFEVICLRREEGQEVSQFTLESESIEYSQECPSTLCLCNTHDNWSEASAFANDDVPLPDPFLISLPHYEDFETLTQSEDVDTAKYYSELFVELKRSTANFTDATINHPINENNPDPLPSLRVSPDVPDISSNCSDTVTCTLYYELDWSYKFRSNVMQCSEVPLLDPCFGTFACECDTGYLRVAANMPELTGEEDIEAEILSAAVEIIAIEEAQAEANAASEVEGTGEAEGQESGGEVTEGDNDSSGLEGWAIALIVIGVLAAVVSGIMLWAYKRGKLTKLKLTKSASKVEPLPQGTQMTEVVTETEGAADKTKEIPEEPLSAKYENGGKLQAKEKMSFAATQPVDRYMNDKTSPSSRLSSAAKRAINSGQHDRMTSSSQIMELPKSDTEPQQYIGTSQMRNDNSTYGLGKFSLEKHIED